MACIVETVGYNGWGLICSGLLLVAFVIFLCYFNMVGFLVKEEK